MAETFTRYPKFTGALTGMPPALSIAREQFLRIYRNTWTTIALAVFLGLAVLAQFTSQLSGMDRIASALNILQWGALGVAAIGAGPAFIDDERSGALELYHARGVSRRSYILGKSLGVWSIVVLAVLVPGLAYYLSGLFTTDDITTEWQWGWAGVLGRSLIWGTVMTGLGLGLSCALRSSRAASLVLFGGVFGLDIVLSTLLSSLTRSDTFQLLSPLSSLQQQDGWLFVNGEAPFDFPFWWGLLVLAGIAAVGWALVALRAPRVRGVD